LGGRGFGYATFGLGAPKVANTSMFDRLLKLRSVISFRILH
jgi:hypothetical protein